MKKLLSLLVCIIFVIALSALDQKKEEKIPEGAKKGFAAKFPTAQKAKWSVEKPGEFEVEYLLNGSKSSSLFDEKGNLLEMRPKSKKVNFLRQ